MRIDLIALLLLLAGAPALGQVSSSEPVPPATLDELLQRVEQSGEQQQRLAAERERAFLAARDRQAELLADIRARREAAEALADRLQVEFEQGEAALAELEGRRQNEAGDLNELFSYVRQAAGDALALVESSPVSGPAAGPRRCAGPAGRRDRRAVDRRPARAVAHPARRNDRERPHRALHGAGDRRERQPAAARGRAHRCLHDAVERGLPAIPDREPAAAGAAASAGGRTEFELCAVSGGRGTNSRWSRWIRRAARFSAR